MAMAMTLGLFAFMAYIINNDQVVIEEPIPYVPVDFAQLPEEKPPEVKPPVKLTPPPPPEPMPKEFAEVESTSLTTGFVYQPPTVDLGTGNTLLTMNKNMPDNDARPIVRINPKYPIAAARDGIEGWVRLRFNINEIGAVTDITVLESQPKRVFNKAAKQALKKWKYKAKSVDGKMVKQEGLTVQLDFNIDQQS